MQGLDAIAFAFPDDQMPAHDHDRRGGLDHGHIVVVVRFEMHDLGLPVAEDPERVAAS